MAQPHPTANLLLLAGACFFAVCSALAWRTRRSRAGVPALGYLALVHLLAWGCVHFTPLFAGGIAPLTLATFPACLLYLSFLRLPGFETAGDLWAGYQALLYVALINACLIALLGFAWGTTEHRRRIR